MNKELAYWNTLTKDEQREAIRLHTGPDDTPEEILEIAIQREWEATEEGKAEMRANNKRLAAERKAKFEEKQAEVVACKECGCELKRGDAFEIQYVEGFWCKDCFK